MGEPLEAYPVLAEFARLVVGGPADRAQGIAIGDGPETKIDFFATLGDEVIRAEISARRVDASALPVE